jgi:exosome complex RNA-binding protein Csl4
MMMMMTGQMVGHRMTSWPMPLLALARIHQMNSELVVPGQRITTARGTPGTGVFSLPDGHLYASLVGKVAKDEATGQVTVTPYPQNAHRSVVPQVEQVILGKV